MANVSSSNGLEKRPKLRFPGFDEPWEKAEIGEVCEQLHETVDPSTMPNDHFTEYSMPAYDNEQTASVVKGKEMNSIRKVLDKPCVLVNKLNVRKKRIWLVSEPEHNAVASAEFVPLASLSLNLDFLLYSSLTDRFTNYLLNCSSGSSNSQKRVTPDVIMNYVLKLPSPEEQKKIGDCLSLLEKRIGEQGLLLKQLKKYKRGLSDSLFAHISQSSGCKIVKLGDAFELLQNNTFSREDLTSELSTVQNIHYGDVLIKYGAIVNIAEDKPPYIKPDIELKKFSSTSYLCDGDIVFADTAEDYTVGKATEIAGANGLSVLSGLHTIPCRPLIKFYPMYLGYYFNSSLFRTQIYPLVQGTKVSSISKGELVKTNVYVPTLEVQKRVALLLYSMDCRIAMEERKSSVLTTARAALLQQLFI